MKITRLEILKGQLKRSRGHSKTGHKGRAPTQRVLGRGCYKCHLLRLIENEEEK